MIKQFFMSLPSMYFSMGVLSNFSSQVLDSSLAQTREVFSKIWQGVKKPTKRPQTKKTQQNKDNKIN